MARFLELVLLSGFAIAQPLFDLLGPHPEFLSSHDVGGAALIALSFAALFVPAVALWGGEALCALASARLASVAGAAVTTVLAALAVVGAGASIAELPRQAWALVVVSVLMGAALAAIFAVLRRRGVLAWAAPLGLVFPLVFLFQPAQRQVWLPGGGERAQHVQLTSDAPVLFIVFDELPLVSLQDESGAIDGERFPNFARLASMSTWFPNATSVSPSTVPSVISLLTSTWPGLDANARAAAHANSLFRILGDRGRVVAVERATHLCPPDVCPELRREGAVERISALASDLRVLFAHRVVPLAWAGDLPPIGHRWRNFANPGGRDPEGGSLPTVLEKLEGDEPLSLAYSHLMLPHGPWLYFPSGRKYHAMGVHGDNGGGWVQSDDVVAYGQQRHLNQLARADGLLGRALDRFADLGWLAQVLVVVVADHGIAFEPGDRFRQLTATNYAELLSIPLFIKLPGQREGRIDHRNAQTIDVLPTLVKALGGEPLATFAGHDLFDLSQAPPLVKEARLPEPLLFDTSSLERRLAELRARNARRFAPGTAGFERAGSLREWVGHRVDAIAPEAPVRGRAQLFQGESYAAVDPEASDTPYYVIGRIRLDAGARRVPVLGMAIALDGVVRATGGTLELPGGWWSFGALLPDGSLHAGRNELEILVALSESGSPRLERLRLDPYPAR
ncbi:MAG: sulfatase-like hydrolase/transferase [Myxococcota bacterium]|nr:sulfatase-like hydrolase/transferase [Myxococcota bacterium]